MRKTVKEKAHLFFDTLTCQFFLIPVFPLLLDTFNTYHSTKICAKSKSRVDGRYSLRPPAAGSRMIFTF